MATDDLASPPLPAEFFDKPGCVLISGESRPLLNWVTMSLLEPVSPRTYWRDVRLSSEIGDPRDPLIRGLVPSSRLLVYEPQRLRPQQEEVDRLGAVSAGLLRSDEPSGEMKRVMDFLRLPLATQEFISERGSSESPILVCTNVNWLSALYPRDTVPDVIHAITGAGVSLVLQWATGAGYEDTALDAVLALRGSDLSRWGDATLRSERGIKSGPLRTGAPRKLSELTFVSKFLERSVPIPSE